MKLHTYDLTTYLYPIWRGKTVYHETALFVGEEDEAPLLFQPTAIVQVCNYGLTVCYKEGEDYILNNGKIKRVKGSKIPYLEKETYYAKTPGAITIPIDLNKMPFSEPRYAMFGEKNTFTDYQISVTYEHGVESVFPQKILPKKAALSSELIEKLTQKPMRVLFYGDSITTGCNSSGTDQGGPVAPYAESFPVMVVKKLQEVLGAQITYLNTAVGGWNTRQGIADMQARVIEQAPDLLILAFGMNDGGLPPAEYKNQISQIISGLRQVHPNCYVLLVSPMLPNPETTWFANQGEYAAPLAELAKETPKTFFADVTALYAEILNRKRYRDITANNVNHPNDFIARLYAQIILATILGDDVLQAEEVL